MNKSIETSRTSDNWPAGVPQPREKLQRYGAASLSDAELLALVLRTGITGKNVVVHSEELLQEHGGLYYLLNKIRKAPIGKDSVASGIGPVKQGELQAMLELGERYLRARLEKHNVLDSSNSVKNFLRLKLGEEQRELFAVIFLDVRNRLQSFDVLFHGTTSQAEVHPKEIARQALAYNSTSVILAHNHPSGSTDPSSADMVITRRLSEALKLLDIKVLDHVIVSANGSYSFAENNQMPL